MLKQNKDDTTCKKQDNNGATWLKQNKDGTIWKKKDNNGATCPQCQTRMHFNRLRDAISDMDAFLIDTERDAISDRDAFLTDTDRDAISDMNAILTDTTKKQDNNAATLKKQDKRRLDKKETR